MYIMSVYILWPVITAIGKHLDLQAIKEFSAVKHCRKRPTMKEQGTKKKHDYTAENRFLQKMIIMSFKVL